MKDLKIIFRNLEKKMNQSNWFDDGWEIYNRGVYLQLYKSNWHNQNQGGIHFETYIEAPQVRQKEFPVCMHAEEDCPAQQKFIEEFLGVPPLNLRLPPKAVPRTLLKDDGGGGVGLQVVSLPDARHYSLGVHPAAEP